MSTYYGLSAKTLRDLAATSPTHAAAIREHFGLGVRSPSPFAQNQRQPGNGETGG